MLFQPSRHFHIGMAKQQCIKFATRVPDIFWRDKYKGSNFYRPLVYCVPDEEETNSLMSK